MYLFPMKEDPVGHCIWRLDLKRSEMLIIMRQVEYGQRPLFHLGGSHGLDTSVLRDFTGDVRGDTQSGVHGEVAHSLVAK